MEIQTSFVKTFNGGCGVIELHDIDNDFIAKDSLKKDLVDWCKADRKEWLKNDLKSVYNVLYIPTRIARFNELSEEEKKKPFGIHMDTIKNNCIIWQAVARVKMYGTKENFIAQHGEHVFNRFFRHDKGTVLDTRWEVIEDLIKNGFE